MALTALGTIARKARNTTSRTKKGTKERKAKNIHAANFGNEQLARL
jgi:hypothetical protein